MREDACDRGAAALLLPRVAFRSSAEQLRADLPALRRAWPAASWATLARRLVDIGLAHTAAAFDSAELAWRTGALQGELALAEARAVAEAYTRGRAHARAGGAGVRAWRLGGVGLGRVVAVGK